MCDFPPLCKAYKNYSVHLLLLHDPLWSEKDAYLRQLLGYSDLTVWAVVDLEPGWLETAFPMSLWDNSLTPPPIKVHLGTEI